MRRPPGSAVLEDSVEDHHQLAHAGHQCHLLGLAPGTQSLVELLYARVVARGDQSPHVQHLPYSLPSAPYRATATQRAGVTVKRSDAHQGRQLLGRELSATKLGQLRQEGPCEHGAHPRHAAQQRLVLAPGGAPLYRLLKVLIGALELLFEPLYVRLDALLDGLAGGGARAVLLGGEHVDDLPTPGQDSGEFAGFLVGDRPRLGVYRFTEAGKDFGIDLVGLGEPTSSAGEISGLSRVDHRNRYPRGGQGGCDGSLQASGGLQHYQRWARRLEPDDQRVDASLIVGDLEVLTSEVQSDVKAGLGDVYPRA